MGEYRANWGPHALYPDGRLWGWLADRDLHRPYLRLPAVPTVAFRRGGRAHRAPALAALRALADGRQLTAPIDQPFSEWAAERFGEGAAQELSSFGGVFTFDHDPGRLSAAFLHQRIQRLVRFPAPVVLGLRQRRGDRYIVSDLDQAGFVCPARSARFATRST